MESAPRSSLPPPPFKFLARLFAFEIPPPARRVLGWASIGLFAVSATLWALTFVGAPATVELTRDLDPAMTFWRCQRSH